MAHAFDTLAADRVFAITAQANHCSERVMQRLGMRRVEGGEFAHPHLTPSDPLSIHLLYTFEARARFGFQSNPAEIALH